MTESKVENKGPAGWPTGMAYSALRHRGANLIVIVFLLSVAFWIGRCTKEPDSSAHGAGGATSPAAGDTKVWTCSMHPNIKLPAFGQCPICFMDLIPVDANAGNESDTQISMSDRARVLAHVETTPVERRELVHEIRMVGKVASDETRLKYISSYVAGRIDRLFVDYTGIMVRKGDHLAELYSPELLVAQREYLVALQRAKRGTNDGASEAGRPVRDAVVDAARRKLELWGIPKDEIERLEREGQASDHMRIDSPMTGYVLEKMGYSGMYVETGTRLFTVVDLSRVWVMLDAYESDMQFLKYGQAVEFEAESFAGHTFAGTIAYIDPVLSEATRTVRVRVNVPNPDMELRPGMFVRGRLDVKLGNGGKVLVSELSGKFICPMHPEIVKDTAGKCDECGMDLVTAESLGFASGQTPATKTLAIPATSVLLTGKRAVVYVEKDGPVYELNEVEIGPRAGEWYVVLSGLEEDDRVVTRGALQIDSAMQIQGKRSMMSIGTEATGDAKGVKIVSRAREGAAYHSAARGVIEGYLQLAAALAADDTNKSRAGGVTLRAAAMGAAEAAPSLGLNSEDATVFAGLMKRIAESAAFANDAGIISMRTQLPKITAPVEEYLLTFGHDREKPVYRAFCPMAFDDKGAFWFQGGTTIDNAYFGSQMLRCGTIRGAIGRDGKETKP